jgi:SAM-dependent methyltransferase
MSNVGPRLIEYKKSTSGRGMNFPDEVEVYSKQWPWGKPVFRSTAKKALELKPDAREIVDIGTGPGFIAIMLSKLSGQPVKAVDIAPNMLKKADEFARKEKGAQIETIEADCGDLPFEGASIDLAVAVSLIHMLDDPLPFFKELRRVVKPGGKALVMAFRRDASPIVRRLGDFQSNVMLKNKALDGMGPVLRASFTAGELESLLREAGLSSFKIKAGIINLQAAIDF